MTVSNEEGLALGENGNLDIQGMGCLRQRQNKAQLYDLHKVTPNQVNALKG